MIKCRGIEIEPDHFSGCGGGEDCPKCEGTGTESLGCPAEECGGLAGDMIPELGRPGWYCCKCGAVDSEGE